MKHDILPISEKIITNAEDFNSLRDLYENYWLIIYAADKSITLKIGFDTFKLEKNSVAFLSKDLFCQCTDAENGFKGHGIAVEEDFFNKANYGLPPDFYNTVNPQPVITINHADAEFFYNFSAYYNSVIKRKLIYKEKILANLLNNLTLVSFELWKKHPQNKKTTPNNNNLTQLCRSFYNLVMQECKHQHDVEYYADKLAVSRNYLTQTVKEITNMTPKEAIQRQLVNETKNLLLNTDLTIKEIADELGFNDASYLCRFFKTKTGKNLTAFRKK
ncbi:MAG: AraC family transcriptional regulator [Bacteroidales bacterium]|nr:AraC family transcriptional regulator [Bacteroidales bacterium]